MPDTQNETYARDYSRDNRGRLKSTKYGIPISKLTQSSPKVIRSEFTFMRSSKSPVGDSGGVGD